LHIPFPEPRDFAVMNADLTEIEPVERRVDTLLRAETDEGTYLLVVEAQGKRDESKRGSWAYYLSYLYAKYRCEPVLIVVTQNRGRPAGLLGPSGSACPAGTRSRYGRSFSALTTCR
jgi:hypothetical protein